MLRASKIKGRRVDRKRRRIAGAGSHRIADHHCELRYAGRRRFRWSGIARSSCTTDCVPVLLRLIVQRILPRGTGTWICEG